MTSTIKVNNVQNQCGANIINESSNTITIGASGDTVSLASGASQSGFGRSGAVDWQTGSIKTATFTAASGEGYFANTSGGAFNMNLPAGTAGAIVAVADYSSSFNNNNLTIVPNGSDKIGGIAANAILSTEGQSVVLVFVDSTKGWVTTQDSSENVAAQLFVTATGGDAVITCGNFKTHIFTGPGTFCVSCAGNSGGSNTVDYFVVAGGGGGGNDAFGASRIGGGGGAGGFRISNSPVNDIPASTMSPLITTTGLSVTATGFPITVGGGGAAGGGTTNPGVEACRGSNSVFSSITSTGGGGGQGHGSPSSPGGPTAKTPGGSGGAIQDNVPNPSGSGEGNTPSVSPPQGNPAGSGGSAPTYAGGGGGGAGAKGTDQSGGQGGPGGAGSFIADAFIGPTAPSYGEPGPVSSVRYFAGGGGSAGPSGPSSGGVGGGGNGACAPNQAATANTGGGGGGRRNTGGSAAGNGGSGIVMIRYKFQ